MCKCNCNLTGDCSHDFQGPTLYLVEGIWLTYKEVIARNKGNDPDILSSNSCLHCGVTKYEHDVSILDNTY